MLVAVCSLKGSPGVTTLCLALAARWTGQQQPVVIEIDPAGGDLLARFRLRDQPGLVSLAAAARHSQDAGLVWRHTQRLPAGLAVVAGPVGAEQAQAALRELTGAGQPARIVRAAADRPDVVVIADCGRVDPGSPVLPVVRSADAMLLLAHARDDELAHVAGKLHQAGTWNRRPGFVLVGNGYPTREVAGALRVGVAGRIPHDPKGAAVLCGQRGVDPRRSGLGRAAARLAQDLAPLTSPASSTSSAAAPFPPPLNGAGSRQDTPRSASGMTPTAVSRNGARP